MERIRTKTDLNIGKMQKKSYNKFDNVYYSPLLYNMFYNKAKAAPIH